MGKLCWNYGHFDSYTSCFLLCDRLDEQGKIMDDQCVCGVKLGFEEENGVEEAVCRACGTAYVKKGEQVAER